MINRINTLENTKTSEILFFDRCDLTKLPNKRIVPLFGPNGSGKTTLINAIGTYLDALRLKNKVLRDDIEYKDFVLEDFNRNIRKAGCSLVLEDVPYRVLSYSNSDDNFRHRRERSINDAFNPALLSARFDANSVSEGQSIVYSVFDLIELLSTGKKGIRYDDGHLIVLIDEMDSGLSIDNIDMFMKKLKYYTDKRDDIQVIFSFNNPRILKFFPHVLSMYTGEVLELHSDEDMLAEFKKHEKAFNKARKLSNGRPKVYD